MRRKSSCVTENPRKAATDKPQRTCVVCRRSNDKANLLRFVLASVGAEQVADAEIAKSVILDLIGIYPGRGAYCHISKCLFDRDLKKKLSYSLLANERKRGVTNLTISEFVVESLLEKVINEDVDTKRDLRIIKIKELLDRAEKTSNFNKGIRL